VAIAPGWREERQWVLSVLVKRTYAVAGDGEVARSAEATPLVQSDVYWDDDPERCSVRFETDLVPYKPSTDVVVIGTARAPRGAPAYVVDVAVEMAGRRKALRVIGDRRCVHRPSLAPAFTEPEPFAEMPIRYERAYGGKDEHSEPGVPFHYPRNPIGRGFALRNVPELVDGLRLPNVEDPDDPIVPERLLLGEKKFWNEAPLPQGLGWYQRNWYPRCSFAGSVPAFAPHDRPMREETLGLVPRDQVALARSFRLPSFDVRLNNGASLGLTFDALRGSERVRLENLTPQGALEFSLPDDRPRIGLDLGGGETELEPALQTVCIRSDHGELDLVWRGSCDVPGIDWLGRMPRLVAEVS
jgi:hypothetical protein